MEYKEKQRTKEIEFDMKYNNSAGLHTFSMCTCNREGCRASKCNQCLNEELKELGLEMVKFK